MKYIGLFSLGALAVFMFGALLDASGSHGIKGSPPTIKTVRTVQTSR